MKFLGLKSLKNDFLGLKRFKNLGSEKFFRGA